MPMLWESCDDQIAPSLSRIGHLVSSMARLFSPNAPQCTTKTSMRQSKTMLRAWYIPHGPKEQNKWKEKHSGMLVMLMTTAAVARRAGYIRIWFLKFVVITVTATTDMSKTFGESTRRRQYWLGNLYALKSQGQVVSWNIFQRTSLTGSKLFLFVKDALSAVSPSNLALHQKLFTDTSPVAF